MPLFCLTQSHRLHSLPFLPWRNVCRQPRAEFKHPRARGVALLPTSQGHYPVLLCLPYGKGAWINTGGKSWLVTLPDKQSVIRTVLKDLFRENKGIHREGRKEGARDMMP
ncbi:hypothetical protein Q7C36_009758 [Tachysurus vachellii]|uniref:Uncharacterized protein n=1 Tax=Tachysurus vachellii TaxID=175792 RepID=A0AA88N4C1_TACVA|nr:hypothetical protein Q7C36_009758 [Tachysurus vachellii]